MFVVVAGCAFARVLLVGDREAQFGMDTIAFSGTELPSSVAILIPAEVAKRYRIDSVLREVEGPLRRLHPSVISHIKIMVNMKLFEKRLPQDGRIAIRVTGRDLDLRVSSIPTNHGENIVIEPLLTVVLAVVVGTIVIALFMPMVSIIGT